MGLTLPCSYLRVFEPLAALADYDRDRVAVLANREVRSNAALGLISPAECRDAFVLERSGVIYASLAKTSIRIQAGALAVAEALGDTVDGIGDSASIRAGIEQMAMAGDCRPRILQSPWHVPLVWLVCFDPVERRLTHADPAVHVEYVAELGIAKERVAKALDVLELTVAPQIVDVVATLARWLKSFDVDSLLQLDYASVTELFTSEELADDSSCLDVSSAISELADGNGIGAAFYYQRAERFWQKARSVAESN